MNIRVCRQCNRQFIGISTFRSKDYRHLFCTHECMERYHAAIGLRLVVLAIAGVLLILAMIIKGAATGENARKPRSSATSWRQDTTLRASSIVSDIGASFEGAYA